MIEIVCRIVLTFKDELPGLVVEEDPTKKKLALGTLPAAKASSSRFAITAGGGPSEPKSFRSLSRVAVAFIPNCDDAGGFIIAGMAGTA